MKECKACREWKELSEFHRSKRYSDGAQQLCKPCNVAMVDFYRKRNVIVDIRMYRTA